MIHKLISIKPLCTDATSGYDPLSGHTEPQQLRQIDCLDTLLRSGASKLHTALCTSSHPKRTLRPKLEVEFRMMMVGSVCAFVAVAECVSSGAHEPLKAV